MKGVIHMEIKQVISELSKIDNAGQSIITSAKSENDDYSLQIAREKEAFDRQLKKDLDEHLKSYSQKLESENTKIIGQLRSDTERQLSHLETMFENKHTQMATEIFNNLTEE